MARLNKVSSPFPRTSRALILPNSRSRRRTKVRVTLEVTISGLPAESETIRSRELGGRSDHRHRPISIGTLVERTIRFTVLIHLSTTDQLLATVAKSKMIGVIGIFASCQEGPWA